MMPLRCDSGVAFFVYCRKKFTEGLKILGGVRNYRTDCIEDGLGLRIKLLLVFLELIHGLAYDLTDVDVYAVGLCVASVSYVDSFLSFHGYLPSLSFL